jgi:hypothetical protein
MSQVPDVEIDEQMFDFSIFHMNESTQEAYLSMI